MRTLSGMLITAALGVGGCALYQPPVPGGWSTYQDMSVYYRRHAMEWNGRCRAPYLDGLLETEVVRESDGQLRILATYHWRDRVGDETGNDHFPFSGTDRCKGIDERTFVLEKADDGSLTTVAMDGLKRGGEIEALFQ